MRFWPKIILSFFLILFPARGALADRPDFITLCYHEVIPALNDLSPADSEPVLLTELTAHFDWLRDNGYHVIGVDDLIRAESGLAPLPPKAVLLSFDDGYLSFYHLVFPLLQAYGYKALLALQTGWLETPANQAVRYGDNLTLPRSAFLNWSQIKEMVDSGLVETASHSHALHQGHPSGPRGLRQPAGSSLTYYPQTKTYEAKNAYKKRIFEDARRSADIIQSKTGRRPRVLVWPYGHYTRVGVQAAREAGFRLTASLGFHDDWPTFPRLLVYSGMNLGQALSDLETCRETGRSRCTGFDDDDQNLIQFQYRNQRVVHVDLDTVYDPDPAQLEQNLSSLYTRLEAMRINVVYLQAYADPDGNGTADALYFPSRHLPMKADLFNQVCWQLSNGLGLKVYAWMPVLGFELPGGAPLVRAAAPNKQGSTYSRLSPFSAQNRAVIKEIYEDLASQAEFSGLIFHDDAILGDYEDASPDGLAWLKSLGLPADFEVIRTNPEYMARFSKAKTKALIDLTLELKQAAEIWRPRLKTARNLYAQVILEPAAETWMAQNLEDFINNYTYTAIMAMPYMEGQASHPESWLEKLAEMVKKHPLGARKTVFELQAVDWRTKHQKPIPSRTLARHMNLLQQNGLYNYGYYPENPIDGHPEIKAIRPFFSLPGDQFRKK